MAAGLKLSTWAALVLLLHAGRVQAQQQEFGHKLLGTIGLKAGSQLPQGLYVADRLFLYTSNELKDRRGDSIPVGMNLDALANGLGVVGVIRLVGPLHWSGGVSVPLARFQVSTDRPEVSADRFGLGDLFVQPLKLGVLQRQWEAVGGYAFFPPTGHFEPGSRSGVGSGSWSHEFSLGGTVYFDRARTWALSALGSYELNGRKRGIDLTRGSSVQVQGGLGKTFFGILDAGLTGHGSWQVTDDEGSAIPEALRGARERDLAAGVELSLLLKQFHSTLTVRYVRELWVRARPQGHMLLLALAVAAYQ